MREFSTGATRDTDEGKPDYRGFISPQALKRFGKYMTEHRKQADGKLRDSDNWKKGIPQREYLSSLLRHVVDYHYMSEHQVAPFKPVEERKKELDDLLCAIWFNVQGLLHERVLGRDVGQIKSGPGLDGVSPRPLSGTSDRVAQRPKPGAGEPERFLDMVAPVPLDWQTWIRHRDYSHYPFCSSEPEKCRYHPEYLRYVSGVTK